MPPRLVSLGILVFWAISASGLLARDVLPDLLIGPPPDLRDLARASEDAGEQTTRWTILVADPSGEDPEHLRAVGRAVTTTKRPGDGHVTFSSHVIFDSGALMQGTPLASSGGEQLEVGSVLDVDEAGNLNTLRSGVRVKGDRTELLVLEGHLEGEFIVISAQGPMAQGPMLLLGKKTFKFPYRARGVVQNSLAPMDRIPGLHVGQRWQSRVVSPLTGRVESVQVEVTDRNVMIPWGDGLVPTYQLVTRMGGTSARTWARASDGLVIRQEVPLIIVTLVLERQPDPPPTVDDLPGDPGRGR